MKKLIYLVLASASFGCSWNPSKTTENQGDSKYQELLKIKEGFTVTHTPEQGEAILGGPSGAMYTWVYTTTVEATENISIIEFGAFNKINDKWIFSNHTGKPFTSKDFEDWYNCPGSKLIPNQKFSDTNNWNGSQTLKKGESLWYYIGKTDSGKIVKATGKLISLPEVIK